MMQMIDLGGRSLLVTGGTGSFGQALVRTVLEHWRPRRLIVFSRDEQKQYEMAERFSAPCLRFFLGDVRDGPRLRRAFQDVDFVVHAAALKQIPAAEYNPFEAVKTNVLGAQNVIEAAIDAGVERVIAISSDKATNPVNLYGATKLCSDKLFIAGNAYAGAGRTRFAVVRYGNVVGSRGSVIPRFRRLRRTGVLPITDPRMTRFWITAREGAEFVLRSLGRMEGGELFVPRLPSMRLVDLARAIAPECRQRVVGVRPGEKLHEILIAPEDAPRTLAFPDYYVVVPPARLGARGEGGCMGALAGGKPVPEDFCYASNTNSWWLSAEELRRMLEEDYAAAA